MKKMFVLGLFFCGLVLSSCGSDEASEVEKKLYDCECNTLITEKGGRFRTGSVRRMIKDQKPYTGTCAILSKDRDAIVTFLAEYSEGYPVKKQKWQLFNGEKIQTWDLSFDSKNLKSGYTMTLRQRNLGLDSANNKRRLVLHTENYKEFNNDKMVLEYWFKDGGSYEHEYPNALMFPSKGQVIVGSKEFTSKCDDCWNKLPMIDFVTADIFTGEDQTVKVKDFFTWEKYAKKEPAAKSYLECLQSKELKKFIVKEAFLDESATVGDVEANVSDEDED